MVPIQFTVIYFFARVRAHELQLPVTAAAGVLVGVSHGIHPSEIKQAVRRSAGGMNTSIVSNNRTLTRFFAR
jgi:hypothetical protein